MSFVAMVIGDWFGHHDTGSHVAAGSLEAALAGGANGDHFPRVFARGDFIFFGLEDFDRANLRASLWAALPRKRDRGNADVLCFFDVARFLLRARGDLEPAGLHAAVVAVVRSRCAGRIAGGCIAGERIAGRVIAGWLIAGETGADGAQGAGVTDCQQRDS